MAAELSRVDPEEPIDHKPTHDLESFFYVLVGVCLLFSEPKSIKSDAQLVACYDPLFTVFKPSVQKTIIIQSDFGWTTHILPNMTAYFEPLIPLLTFIRKEFILSTTMADSNRTLNLLTTRFSLPSPVHSSFSQPHTGRHGMT